MTVWPDLERTILAGDIPGAFRHLHAFCMHVAAVSKLIWPPNRLHKNRQRKLIQELAIGSTSPLKDREFRNQLEHYDDRLHEWYATSPRKGYLDRSILPVNAVAGLPDQDRFRVIDPMTFTFYFWNRPYKLCVLRQEIERIQRAAQRWLAAHDDWGRPI